MLGLNELATSYLFTSPKALTSHTPKQRELCEKMKTWMEDCQEEVNAVNKKIAEVSNISLFCGTSTSYIVKNYIFQRYQIAYWRPFPFEEKEETIQSLKKKKEINDQVSIFLLVS